MSHTLIHPNAIDAIQHAIALAPCGVAYLKGEGWFPYDLIQGCPAGSEPEFLVLAQGKPPIPLTEVAAEVWLSAVRSRFGTNVNHPAFRDYSPKAI